MYSFQKQFINHSSTAKLIQNNATEADHSYAKKFKRKDRQIQSLVGRCLIRQLAVEAFPESQNGEWTITPQEERPPLLSHPNHPTPFISISHSHDLGVAAISTSHPIGVDVEYRKEERDIRKLLQAVCNVMDHAPLPTDKNTLYRIWSLFEAWFKTSPQRNNYPIPKEIIAYALNSSIAYNQKLSIGAEHFAVTEIPDENYAISLIVKK